MASTETGPPAAIVPLSLADLPAALALSVAAGWNQNESDWRAMLSLGRGWGIHDRVAGGPVQLAASTVVLPYGDDFAWVSMVLVLPALRRRGHASALLRHALAALAAEGRAAVLDATPAGHAVYRQAGFADAWGFARWRREPPAAPPPSMAAGIATRGLRDSDWPAVAALDAAAFGADRLALLHDLARRLPPAARVLDEPGGRLRGFVLGRDGREAAQIGPLVAADDADAKALLGDALAGIGGAVYADLCDHRDRLLPWLRAQGFVMQRPFTRMVRVPAGRAAEAPGDPRSLALVAGPEFG